MTVALLVVAILILLVLGGIYQAIDRCAHALGRIALTAERWSGDWRTSMMFPDDAPVADPPREHWRPDQDPGPR